MDVSIEEDVDDYFRSVLLAESESEYEADCELSDDMTSYLIIIVLFVHNNITLHENLWNTRLLRPNTCTGQTISGAK